MECNKIIKRLSQLESERTNIQSLWILIEQFVVPFRGKFFNDVTDEGSVEWRTRDVYDSTAIMSNQILAASIHGSLTSPSYRWFDLRFRSDKASKVEGAQVWLDECSSLIYAAIQDSNFNLEVNETYTDLTSFGSAPIMHEFEGDDVAPTEMAFASIPVKECYFDEDSKGNIKNFYRVLNWTAIQIADKFGLENCPQYVKDKAIDPSASNERMDVIFCVYDREMKDADPFTIAAPEKRAYGYKYLMRKDGHELKTGGYYEMPAYMPRWRKTSESKWGNSPAFTAMPDILTMNQLVELILKATEKVVDPAILATERGLLSEVDLSAGGLTVVRTLDDMKPFESGARFDVSQLQREQLKSAIRSAFYVDQLELKQSPAMTATEVQVRYELMQRLLGPTLGRIQNDFLSPLIERTFRALYRAKKLPELPDGLEEQDIDVQYVGPLSRAQKVDTAAAAERWLGTMAALAEYSQDVLDILDIDEIGRDMGDILNVPAKYIRSPAKVTKIRKDRSAAQAQAQQAALAEQEGKAMKAVGEGAAALGGIPSE